MVQTRQPSGILHPGSDDFHELERKAAVETKENMRTGWRSSLRKVVKIWNRKRY